MATPHYLGVDIGGTKVALRVETDAGCVDEITFRWAPDRSAAEDLTQLGRHLADLRTRIGAPLRAVGVAMPGTVGPDGRITAWPSRPAWTGLDLDTSLRALFGAAPVAWADDGDLGALAEARASGCDDLLYLGVGTGVGGGLVLNGAPCPGPSRGSFEIGHVVVDLDGPRCVCGRQGCLQAIASGPATLHRAALLRGTAVTFDDLRQALSGARPWAVTAVDRTARALAAAVTGVRELVHPERVVIGGGFVAGIPEIVGLVSAHLAQLARPGQPPPRAEPATLGALSSLRGAVSLARLVAS
nr:ROK family protein [uncultured bacterium]